MNSRIAALSGSRRAIWPKPNRGPLPPFDPDDSGGQVHRVPPPELQPPNRPDRLFMRADFNGVTLDVNRWGGNPPYLNGANSTPLAMLMTPMLPLYPAKWRDACLTEHAERYTHVIFDPRVWNAADNGRWFSPQDIVDFARYVQSWGFFAVCWSGRPTLDDVYLKALVNAHALDFYVCGEEVDGKFTAEQYAALLENTLTITANGIPIGAHFTSNYPEGSPRDTFFDGRSMPGWSHYNGRVHLCWQANQNESAGTQAARLYYARQRVNLGSVAGDGQLAPDSRVYAFETMATAQLYGQCDEDYGNLRTLELMFATRDDPRVAPMGGYGNGCRQANGDAL